MWVPLLGSMLPAALEEPYRSFMVLDNRQMTWWMSLASAGVKLSMEKGTHYVEP